jgi:nucleotide-binding universal stress UspA family protein
MKLFSRIGAYLSGGPADESVLRHTGELARLGGSKHVFVTGISEDAPRQGEWESFDARVRDVLSREAGGVAVDVTVVDDKEEPELDDILRSTREHDLDLLVMGRRIPSHQLARASLFPKLLRKCPCSVMLVTRHRGPVFRKALVPTDFSPHSGLAVQVALTLTEASAPGKGEVVCHHIFEVPYGYAYAGVTREEYAAEQRKHAEEGFAQFLASQSIQASAVRCEYTPAEHAPTAVAEMALAEGVDLVAVGSRGRTKASALLLGSTAEKLVGVCAAPLLVVKEKGETLGLLDALFDR